MENEKFNMKIKLQKPVRSQVFKYRFAKWKPDDKMIRLRDICHAIGNCDTYPIPFPDAIERRTPEAKIMMETLDAALAAIEQCPVYTGTGDHQHLMRHSMASLNEAQGRY